MRAVTLALAAIPVVFGGLGLAAVVGVFDPFIAPTPASEETQISQDTESRATAASQATGTVIDGRRPHLSVIDGHVNLFLPAPMPAILSLLPIPAVDLAPLPGSGADDAPAGPGEAGPGSQTSPGAGAQSGSGTASDPSAGAAPASPAAVQPTAAYTPPAAPRARPPEPPQPPGNNDPGQIGGPRFDLDTLARQTGERVNNAIPPHAGKPGRPPHADTSGPPPHASDNNRSAHAATNGRPDHAAGGGPKSDNGRSAPR
ncbi:hypothetical protein [Dietzia aurantiaca]|uniref:Uncharacterized protein n=1 Tax=Dietzia aurantiaca TaxID=983873 RepID=A0ABV9PYV3_9ACTN